jgi:phospholipid-binding lipoprotein MlaA
MRLLYFSLSILLFILPGCTTKEISPQSNIEKTETVTSNNSQKEISANQKIEDQITENEFGDEFEDEFSEKETNDTIDPLSGYNKVMTSFNDNVIIYGLSPIAEAYATILPQPFRLGISNFVHNIQFPIRFTNNLLQGKFQNSSDELERFIVNSTIGLAGLMDPAKHYMNIHPHDEDFGQTLGYYGVGSGFHVVLPFIGPSNVRDILGITADAYLSPLVNVRGLENYKIPQNLGESIGIYTIHLINKTSLHLGEYQDLKKDAIELYPFLKDIYEQKRNSEIAE